MLYNWDFGLLCNSLHLDSSQIFCNVSLDDVDGVTEPYKLPIISSSSILSLLSCLFKHLSLVDPLHINLCITQLTGRSS